MTAIRIRLSGVNPWKRALKREIRNQHLAWFHATNRVLRTATAKVRREVARAIKVPQKHLRRRLVRYPGSITGHRPAIWIGLKYSLKRLARRPKGSSAGAPTIIEGQALAPPYKRHARPAIEQAHKAKFTAIYLADLRRRRR